MTTLDKKLGLMMSIHGVLGETTSYPKAYNPQILYPIARSLGRDEITIGADKLNIGVDWWHAYEVSWLNLQGISQVAIARFSIPAASQNIVESKSLKLYLNSLNFTEFASWQAVEDTISKDLSDCVKGWVTVELFDLTQLIDASALKSSGLQIDNPQGKCIDNALDDKLSGLDGQKLPLYKQPQPSLLKSLGELVIKGCDRDNTHNETADDSLQTYQLYSNLLRSNCPVTNQPDWGRVAIELTTQQALDEANVLAYILSYRQHNGFHEQCVEQIFADLTQVFKPTKLMVRAWYTRRGGIDINPCRVSEMSLLPIPSRLIRQ